jgi:hypothetical protein
VCDYDILYVYAHSNLCIYSDIGLLKYVWGSF